MNKAYTIKTDGILVFCEEEAAHIAEGSPIIAGTFEETTSAWTGKFTADDGRTYEIIDGYILKEVQAS